MIRRLYSELSEGLYNSYGQILFLNKPVYGKWLLMVSFLFPFEGLSGVICVLSAHGMARLLGFDRGLIRSGFLGYNALMTGLVLGSYYQFNVALIAMLLLGAMLSLLLTLWLRKLLYAQNLPFLSLPFLLSVWVMLLSVRNYKVLRLSDSGIYSYNELAQWGGLELVRWYQKVQALAIPGFWDVYFKSLGAIFFQYNLLAGLVIALVLLLHSRIAFLYSIVGFLTGYLFYRFVDGHFTELHYSYIGFNFILTSIALGSFFLIPGFWALLVSVIAVPITALLISALGGLFFGAQLPLYSLPFNLVVLIFIVVLRQRWQQSGPQLVWEQQGSPEKNLYSWQNRKQRFKNAHWMPIELPFFGEWRVSQGHDGGITHKDAYAWAWDFDIVGSDGKTYKAAGLKTSDYYCYDKPVCAPAAGWVVELVDELPDNEIGDADAQHNWGNTIILKHAEGLFSKLSHLKAGSFAVALGDYVKSGQLLARCGSSGRSPEPHLHFQLQSTAYVDAVSLWYPIGHFLEHGKQQQSRLRSFEIPVENSHISRVEGNSLMRDAFRWQAGQLLHIRALKADGREEILEWQLGVDALNYSYLYCPKSNSTAWYAAGELEFVFTHFVGDRKSALFQFYIAAQKVLLADLPEQLQHDEPELPLLYQGPWLYLQDVLAPFVRFLHPHYQSNSRVIKKQMNEALAAETAFRYGVYFNSLPSWKQKLAGLIPDAKNRLHSYSGHLYFGRNAYGKPKLESIQLINHPLWRELHFS